MVYALECLSIVSIVFQDGVNELNVGAYLKNQKANVYLLQETFSNSKDEKIWAAEWGGQIFYSHGSNHSKGVCVLIKSNSPLHVEIVELDVNGRFIILCLKTPGEINLNVVNVYAPTDPREQIDFINSFSKKIISLTNTCNARVFLCFDSFGERTV